MLVLVLAVLPLLFNACGGPNGFHGLNEMSSFSSTGLLQKKVCETELIANYAATYHPLMKNNCNNCHSNAHGSTDVRLSYNAFSSKGQALINYQATNPHGGNSINLTNEIAAVQQPWANATAAYTECLVQNPNKEEGTGVAFNVMENDLTGITGCFKEFAWDLYINSGDRAGQIQARFTIDARLYTYDGSVTGFEFRNPALQLAGSQAPIQIDGIKFTVMGQLQDSTTTYSRVSETVSGTAKTMLAPGVGNAFVFLPTASASVPVGFQFINLK